MATFGIPGITPDIIALAAKLPAEYGTTSDEAAEAKMAPVSVEATPKPLPSAAAEVALVKPSPSTIADPNEYSLAMPKHAMYGWAAELAEKLGGPLGYSYASILAYFAGTRQLAHGYDMQSNLFVALLGDAGRGKSRTLRHLNRALGFDMDSFDQHVVDDPPASDRGLLREVGYDPEEGQPPLRHCVLLIDEMKELFLKANITGSTLPTMLCKVWSSRRAGSPSKTHNQKLYAQVSMLGGLKVTNSIEFREAFGKATGGGLWDRFIFVPGPTERWDWPITWKPPVAFAKGRTADPVELPEHILATLEDWRQARPDRERICEIVLRVAVIASAINHDCEVTRASMAAAMAFGEWQEQVRSVYRYGEGSNPQAECTTDLIDALARAQTAWQNGERVEVDGRPLVESGMVHFSRFLRKTNLGRSHGSVMVRNTLQSLVQLRLVEEQLDEKNKPTGYYRVIEVPRP